RLVTLPAELIVVDPASGQGTPIPPQILKLQPEAVETLKTKLSSIDADIAKAQAEGKTVAASRLESTKAGLVALFEHLERFETTLPELRRLAAGDEFRSRPVHPAQLYSAVGPLLLAWLLSAYFYRRSRHGTVMALAMILYGFERF